MTYEAAAVRLGVSVSWLRARVRELAIPHHVVAGRVRFSEDDLAEILHHSTRRVQRRRPDGSS